MEITPIPWDGEKISKPGIYSGVPIDVYHSDCCDGPSISSSGLRKIFDKGSAAYWMTSPYNPCRLEVEEKDHFILGRAAHTLLLGEDGFDQQYVVRPEIWVDWRKAEARRWRDDMHEMGKTVLTPEQVTSIKGMAGVLDWYGSEDGWKVDESGLAHCDLAKQGLLEGHVECSIFWREEETGVWLKARPDVIPVADAVVVDLKTTSADEPERSIYQHGYHMQGALVGEGLASVGAFEMAVFALCFVDVRPPYSVDVQYPDPHQDPTTGELVDPIAIGREQNRHAVRIFARCMAERRWPASSGEARPAHMPNWYRRKVERALQPQPELEAA